MGANDSCGMASLDTRGMDVGMTEFYHYKSMGAIFQSSNLISPKTTWNISRSLPDDALYLIWLKMARWYVNGRWDDEHWNIGILIPHMSFRLRWANNIVTQLCPI